MGFVWRFETITKLYLDLIRVRHRQCHRSRKLCSHIGRQFLPPSPCSGLAFRPIDLIAVSKSAPKALILAPNRLRPGEEEAKQQEAQAQIVAQSSDTDTGMRDGGTAMAPEQEEHASTILPRFSILDRFSLLRRHRCASISLAGVCVGALSLLHLVQRGVKSLDLVSLVLQWLNQPINAS